MKKTAVTLGIVLFAATLVVFFACNKTTSTGTSSTNSNPNHIPPDQMVTASLQGRVVDGNGIPIQGAAVSSGGTTTSTDINGVFSFSQISLSSRFGYVKVDKQGYFEGSRSVITNAGASNYVNIQLVPKTSGNTFPAPTGGKIAVGTGDTVSFAASSVVEASSGAAYTGTVTVFATYLNPTDPGLYKYMPGDLRGIGSDGNETALQSFGMMDVELQDDAGNKLQLAVGQQATLSFTIPDTLLAAAPATIPLWYFNDTTGRWIQQGMAVKQGNTYVGQVGHFTFWNCDAPMGTVNFKVHVIDQFGNPVAYRYIQFNSIGYGARGGYTDATGFAQGMLPKGIQLQMQVLSDCGGFVGGFNVGPALGDQDMGTVTVNIVFAELTITGMVVDCNHNPVDSGYVNALVDGLNYRALVTGGSFSLPVNRCYASTASVQLLATDLSNGGTSLLKTITVDTGAANAGTLTACSLTPPPSQYLNFTFEGTSYNLSAPADNISAATQGGVYTQLQGSGTGVNIQLIAEGLTGAGSYSNGVDSALLNVGTSYFYGPVSYSISSYGPVGSYIQGSFTGTVTSMSGTDQEQLSGTFNLLRVN